HRAPNGARAPFNPPCISLTENDPIWSVVSLLPHAIFSAIIPAERPFTTGRRDCLRGPLWAIEFRFGLHPISNLVYRAQTINSAFRVGKKPSWPGFSFP